MSEKKKILKNTFYSSISIYTEYVLGLVCSIIIARTLGATEYGVYSLLIWVAASSIILINGGINTGQIKFLSEFNKKYDEDYTLSALNYFRKIQTAKTIFILLIGASISEFIIAKFNFGEYRTFYWIILISVLFKGRYMFHVSIAKGFEHFDKLSKLSLIVTPINLVFIIIAGIYIKNIGIFIYIYFFTSILFYLFSYLIIVKPIGINRLSNTNLNKNDLSRINNYLKITSVIVILSYFVSKELELFMLGWLAEPSDAGLFRIAMTLAGSIMLMAPGVFSSVLLPMMSKSLAESKQIANRRFYDSTRILIILSIPITTFIIYISNSLVIAIYGEEFANAGIALSICIVAVTIVTIADSAQSYLLSAEKQKTVLYILIIALFLKISIGYFLIANYQLIGAAVTYLIAILFSYLSRIYLTCYYLKSKFPFLTLIKSVTVSLICLLPLILIGENYSIYINILIFSAVYGISFTILSFATNLWSKEDILMFINLSKRIPAQSIQNLIIRTLENNRK